MLKMLDRYIGPGRLVRALTVGLVILGAVFLAACGDDQDTQTTEEPQQTTTTESAPPSEPPIQVVTTTNFVADWARIVGGERVEVFGLLPPGGDPHSFQPGARDVARVADADVVFTVGLGLEAVWLEELVHSASADESKIVALGEVVDPMEFATADMHDDHADHDDEADMHDHEDEADHDDHADHDDEADMHDHDDEADHDDHADHDDEADMHDHEDEADHDDHADHDDEADMHDHDDEADHDDHADHDDEADMHDHDDEADHDDHADHDDEADMHDDGHDDHGHAHGPLDPHFWFDPIRVKAAVNEIANRLSAIDAENADVYRQNASDYGKQLDELHAWIQEQVGMLAPERRLLVTSHDSLSYFAEVYGFEVVGLVIPSLATHVEPSAEHIAGLVDVVREHNVPALFGETTVSDKLAQAVANETGASLVQLYSGSLGAEGSGADTYLTMVRTNVERIVGALK